MATYRFRVWQSGSAPYEVTGNGMSWGYARENVARREGVDVSDVMPINGNAPIDDDSSSSGGSSGFDAMGSIMLIGVILLFGLIITYWKWILIGGIIVGILWWWCKDEL